MFTDPEAYFLEQYPVDSIEDAEAIATKVIDIVRMFNPDIPDFSSIRSMLESLLRELGEKVLTYGERLKTINNIELRDVREHHRRTHTSRS